MRCSHVLTQLSPMLLALLFMTPFFTMAFGPESVLVMEGESQFSTKLYNQIAAQPGNLFFSPLSLHIILSMIYQGAETTTANILGQVIGISYSDITANGYRWLIKELNNMDKITLDLANKVFVMNGKQINSRFEQALTSSFFSNLTQLDFGKNVESAKIINDWVSNQTHCKIKDLIQSGDLNVLSRMVLVNAIYFKGNWASKFNPKDTTDDDFYISRFETVTAKMMFKKNKFRYRNDVYLDSQIVELPYSNRDFSMIIILPNKIDGIKDLEAKLTTLKFDDIVKDLNMTIVHLSIPKFKIENTIDLEDILSGMGLGEIFDPQKADFSQIIEGDNVFVSKAIQKSFIEVNEEGSEAATTTGVSYQSRSGRLRFQKVNVTVDHPFIFQIVYKYQTHPTNYTVLFQGRVTSF